MFQNLILCADSYKYSHHLQFPEGIEKTYYYIESRGGMYDFVLFYGLQAFLKEYLQTPVTRADIDEAETFVTRHGLPFNRKGWERVVNKCGGYLPITITAVPEGTAVPNHNVLAVIENDDPEFYWVPGFIETALLRGVWYGSTVATRSKKIKNLLAGYLERTADSLDGLPFTLHDFGARGVSSHESAGIAGSAHLINFMGTDNLDGIRFAQKYYGPADEMFGLSIPASEHSVTCSWGKGHELDFYRNMLTQFGGPGKIYANVADTYNIYYACKTLFPQLKDELRRMNSTMVVRPDSGDPAEVVSACIQILADSFGHHTNGRGYKVLENVRIIQGDGIDETSIVRILDAITRLGFSAENLTFGCGGYLLQRVNRDTQKFAMKCSAVMIHGEWRDIFKDPITDHDKKSKQGRVTLYAGNGGFYSAPLAPEVPSALVPVYRNGEIITQYTFNQVRANAG